MAVHLLTGRREAENEGGRISWRENLSVSEPIWRREESLKRHGLSSCLSLLHSSLL